MKNLKNFAILIGCLMAFLVFYLAFAWTEPSATPPAENVPAPLNVSINAQAKEGSLIVGNNSAVTTGLIVRYGNVGIGTTTPGAKLSVSGTGNVIAWGTLEQNLLTADQGGSIELGGTNAKANPVSGGVPYIDFHYGTGSAQDFNFRIINQANNRLDFASAGQGAFVSFNAGNVGIGTTAPSYKLDVVGAIRLQPSSAPTGANGVIYYDSSTNKFRCYQNGAWVDCIASGGLGGSGTTNYVAKFTGSTTLGNSQIFDNGTSVGIGTTNPSTSYKLDVNGGVRATAFYYTSDLALKTNIKPLENSLAKILQLQGVSFNWKDSGEPSIGLIAQEVEKIFPELVSGNEGSKTVDYGKLVPVLIEAIKEQQNEIEKLKLEIEALKSK
jgi:hypothetical protein